MASATADAVWKSVETPVAALVDMSPPLCPALTSATRVPGNRGQKHRNHLDLRIQSTECPEYRPILAVGSFRESRQRTPQLLPNPSLALTFDLLPRLQSRERKTHFCGTELTFHSLLNQEPVAY